MGIFICDISATNDDELTNLDAAIDLILFDLALVFPQASSQRDADLIVEELRAAWFLFGTSPCRWDHSHIHGRGRRNQDASVFPLRPCGNVWRYGAFARGSRLQDRLGFSKMPRTFDHRTSTHILQGRRCGDESSHYARSIQLHHWG